MHVLHCKQEPLEEGKIISLKFSDVGSSNNFNYEWRESVNKSVSLDI